MTSVKVLKPALNVKSQAGIKGGGGILAGQHVFMVEFMYNYFTYIFNCIIIY